MANVTTELKVVVRSIGKGEIDKLSASLLKLGEKAVEPVNEDLKKSVTRLKTLSEQSKKTKNNVKGFSDAFKELANNLEFGSKEFKEATAEAKKLDAQLQKMEGRRGPAGAGRLRAGAQVAGTVAGAGVFGGPEGAIGAGIGAIAGGVPGAVIGGAIGAQVGGIRQALGATAEYAANLGKLRIALQGVTTSQDEYKQSLAFIQQTTKDFAIPQEVVTRQFTKLQASVQGAGGNVEDTKTAFNGIVAAVRATGGSLADVDAALTATAQVFSKGKVSAEELRQQIGERLPGAFTLFAEAIGMTPQELDKALEKGQVSLQDFQKFAEAIFKRYGENAKAIADDPKSAGDRLKVALEELSESVGTLLQPIGQAFQDIFTQITKVINTAIAALNRFLGLGQEGLEARIETLTKRIDQSLATAEAIAGTPMAAQARAEAARLFDERSDLMVQLRQLQTRGIEQPEAGTGLPGIIPSGGGDKAAARAAAAQEKQRLAFLKKINAEINRMNEAELKGIEAGRKIIEQIDEKGAAQIEKGEANLALLQAQLDGRLEEEQLAQKIKEIEESNLNDIQKQKQISILNQTAALKEQIKLREKDPLVKMRDDLDKLLDKTNQTAAAATAIGNAFSNAFTSIINGTKSADQAIADMLSSVAEHFMDMAAQIIAKQLAMIAYGLIMKALGVGLGSAPDAGDANAGTGFLPMISPGEAPYGTLPGEFAEGGYVSGPTRALIGEGGQGEYVIPESKMRESMARYSRGARGAAVIPEAGGSGTSGEGQAMSGSNAIDVRYTVERINSVDYVTADQFQAGMQQAAAQGAKQGEQQTLKRLQMSGSTRKRLGM